MGAKNILIIEDDPDLALVVEISLTMARPWQVTITSSGKEGVKRAKSGNFHAILLDLSMPDMDGIEVLSILRKDKKTSSTPVVLLTAMMNGGSIEYTQLPVSGLIQKPFDPVTLADTLSHILCW